MKYISNIIFSTTFFLSASGQVDTKPFVDQFMISINSTLEDGYGTANRAGYGLGIYHTVLPEKQLNFNAGIEFNRTRQFEKFETVGHLLLTMI